MGKLRCPCGAFLSNSYSPHPWTGYIVSGYDVDDLDYAETPTDYLIDKCRQTWECEDCGRIWIAPPGENIGRWYEPRPDKEG